MSMSPEPSHNMSSAAIELLSSLSTTPTNKTSYVTGTLALPKSAFMIHYGGHLTSCSINLLKANTFDIEDLVKVSEPGTVMREGKSVVDEAYRKSQRLSASSFTPAIVPERTALLDIIRDFLLEGKDSTRAINVELCELEIYGEGSFSKPHCRTQDGDGVFGTLILTFPIPHKGGALALQPHNSQEHVFDTGSKLSSRPAYVGYAAFWGDVEHEVLPVTSGHRITLQYNLSWAAKRATPAPLSSTEQTVVWSNMLQRLIADDTVLPDGGLFCFGLRNSYSVPAEDEPDMDEYKPSDIREDLRGADLLLISELERLGLDAEVLMSYEGIDGDGIMEAGNEAEEATFGLTDHLISFYLGMEQTYQELVQEESYISSNDIDVEQVIWITPITTATRLKQSWAATTHKAAWAEHVYANFCICARVQPYSERQKKTLKRKRLAGEAAPTEEDSA